MATFVSLPFCAAEKASSAFLEYMNLHPFIIILFMAFLMVIILLIAISVTRGRIAREKTERLDIELEQQRKLGET